MTAATEHRPAAPRPLPEIALPSPEQFRDAVVGAAEPVVMRGLVQDWPLTQAGADPEHSVSFLAEFDRGAAAEIFVGPPEIGGRFFYREDMRGFNFERRKGPLLALLRHLLQLRGTEKPPALYAGAMETATCLPGLAEANPMPLLDGLAAVPRLWAGNASTVSTHFDVSDNVACVVAGRRRFTLFPPDQLANLYVGPLDWTMAGQPVSMVKLNAPDLDRYPRFADALASARTAELGPGDSIYIPALWWHQVDALADFNLLLNYWWSDGPDPAARFDAMVHATLAISHLPPGRRAAWQAMFDHFVFRANGDPAAHLAPEHRGILGRITPRLRDYIRQYLMRGLQRP